MALGFTGNASAATNYLTSPDNAAWDMVGPKTLSIWAKKVDNALIEYYFVQGLESGSGYRIRSNQYGGLMINLGDAAGGELILSTAFNVASGWTNFVFTLDGSGNLTGYRNGVEDGSKAVSSSYASTRSVVIGTNAGWNSAPTTSANANAAEIATWNRVLSAGEIKSLSTKSPGTIPVGLTAYISGREVPNRSLAVPVTENGSVNLIDHPPVAPALPGRTFLPHRQDRIVQRPDTSGIASYGSPPPPRYAVPSGNVLLRREMQRDCMFCLLPRPDQTMWDAKHGILVTPSTPGTAKTINTGSGLSLDMEIGENGPVYGDEGRYWKTAGDQSAMAVTFVVRPRVYDSWGGQFFHLRDDTESASATTCALGFYAATPEQDGIRFAITRAWNASQVLFQVSNVMDHPLTLNALKDVWSVITLSWGADDSGITRAYRDGIFVGDTNTVGGTLHTGVHATSASTVENVMRIGRNGSGGLGMDGDLAMFMWHNRRVEGVEVREMHQNISSIFQ